MHFFISKWWKKSTPSIVTFSTYSAFLGCVFLSFFNFSSANDERNEILVQHIFNLCTCPQIALFMEMTPSHLSSTLLKHVSLKFYLDDSAHLLQPLNQGIVRDFKAYFRRRLLQTALAHSSAGDGGEERDHQTMKTVTELDAMFWIQVREFEHSLFSLSVKVFWRTSTNILEFFWVGGGGRGVVCLHSLVKNLEVCPQNRKGRCFVNRYSEQCWKI